MTRSEALSRVKKDALLRDACWTLADGKSVLYEHTLPDGTRTNHVLCERSGRPMAVLEAKRPLSTQSLHRNKALTTQSFWACRLFSSRTGAEAWHLNGHVDAHARTVATFFFSSGSSKADCCSVGPPEASCRGDGQEVCRSRVQTQLLCDTLCGDQTRAAESASRGGTGYRPASNRCCLCQTARQDHLDHACVVSGWSHQVG